MLKIQVDRDYIFYKFDLPEVVQNKNIISGLCNIAENLKPGKNVNLGKYPLKIGKKHLFWVYCMKKEIDTDNGRPNIRVHIDHSVNNSRVDSLVAFVYQDVPVSDEKKIVFIYARKQKDTDPKLQMLSMTSSLWDMESQFMDWGWMESQISAIPEAKTKNRGRKEKNNAKSYQSS